MSEVAGWGSVRTVCHGCRTMREVIEQVGPHRFESHPLVLAGEGTIYRRVRAFDSGDAVVEIPCPDCDDCGDGESATWLLPGLIPPA
jgi:hypothetical protein